MLVSVFAPATVSPLVLRPTRTAYCAADVVKRRRFKNARILGTQQNRVRKPSPTMESWREARSNCGALLPSIVSRSMNCREPESFGHCGTSGS